MARPIRKDLKSSPQKEPLPAPELAATKPAADGSALDVFTAGPIVTAATRSTGPAGAEAARQAGQARLEPAVTRDFTVPKDVSQTKEPDSSFASIAESREDMFSRISQEVLGREPGIGEEGSVPEALRDLGRDALQAQVDEAIPRADAESAGDRTGRMGTPEDLGVSGAFGTKADISSGSAGMDLFNVSLPSGGASSARDDLAILTGMIPGGRGSAGAIPSVAEDDTIPDAPPVDDTAADPQEGSALDNPFTATPTAPPLPVIGGRSLVFGGAAGKQNLTTDEAADAAGDLGSAVARLIPGPVGQVANSFFVGWRAGRAIDNATGVGEKAVNAALPLTEAGKFEAEMTRKAAEAEAAARARDANKGSSGDATPAPHVSRPSEFGTPDVTPEYMAWRAAGRERHGLGQPGSGDVDPTDEGNEAVPSVGPGPNTALHVAVGMSEDATRNFLLGQPVEDAVRGGGSLDFGNLPGDRGNIDFGPDSTGAWSSNTRTESEADALGAYRPSLGISDANSTTEQEEDSDDANAD